MSGAFLACLIVLIIHNASAQYKMSELQPQTIPTLQAQNLKNLLPMGLTSPPRMKLVSQRHRYVIKKAPKKKIAKRQLLAELFKQSAMKNVQDAASMCNREKKSINFANILRNTPMTFSNDVARLNNGVYNLKYYQ